MFLPLYSNHLSSALTLLNSTCLWVVLYSDAIPNDIHLSLYASRKDPLNSEIFSRVTYATLKHVQKGDHIHERGILCKCVRAYGLLTFYLIFSSKVQLLMASLL